MTQRLALHHILTSQLSRNWERDDSARAKLAKLNGRLKSSLRSIHVPARYQAMMPDTRKTYDNMVERIHQTMQEVRPKRRPLPKVALPDAAIPAGSSTVAPPLPSTLVSKNYSKRSRSGRFKGGANQSGAPGGVVTTYRTNPKPMALIRAGLDLKVQRAKSGAGEVRNPKGFAVQRHMNEVIRQKNVLESMLMQHKRLRQDRQTIVMDMQRMRADLDKICNKLDTSLQCLNSTRTLCSAEPPKEKEPLPKVQKVPKVQKAPKVMHSGVVRHKFIANPVSPNKPRKSGTQKKTSRTIVVKRSGILKVKTNPILRNRVHAN